MLASLALADPRRLMKLKKPMLLQTTETEKTTAATIAGLPAPTSELAPTSETSGLPAILKVFEKA
jgi:hypothetical protein